MANLYCFNRILTNAEISSNSFIIDKDRAMTVLTTKPVKQSLMQPYVVPYSKDDCVRDIKAQLEMYSSIINNEK